MEQKQFTVLGTPISLQRPRFSKGAVYDPQEKEKFAWGIQLRNQYHGPVYTGPVRIEIQFYFPMPKSQQRKHDQIRGTHHTYKPDIDNLIKWVLDVSHGILYEDDSIVSEIISKKIYADNPRTEFTIIELTTNHPTPEEVAARIKKQIGGRHNSGSKR